MVWVIWPYTKKIQFDAMPDDVPSSTVLDHLRLWHTRGATSTATRKQVCFDGSSSGKARRKKKRCCCRRSHSSNQRRLSLSDFLLLHNIRELLLLPRWRHARKHARWTGLLKAAAASKESTTSLREQLSLSVKVHFGGLSFAALERPFSPPFTVRKPLL